MRSKLTMILAMIGILLAASACSSAQGDSNLENKTWKLESYGEPGNLKTVLEGTEITATFDSADRQVHGSAGANTYFGSYNISGNRLSILDLARTEMYRLDPPGVMEQEGQYLDALKAAESFQIKDGKLQINSGKQILIYTEQNLGILQGSVTIGPVTPVERPGETPPVPPEVYAARKIMVYDENGDRLIAQVDIDDEGNYRVELEPGSYTVDINSIGIDRSSDVPRIVEIASAKTTILDIDIDTGIR